MAPILALESVKGAQLEMLEPNNGLAPSVLAADPALYPGELVVEKVVPQKFRQTQRFTLSAGGCASTEETPEAPSLR